MTRSLSTFQHMLLSVLTAGWLLAGCTTHRILPLENDVTTGSIAEPHATHWQTVTRWSWLWGLKENEALVENCVGRGLSEVKVRRTVIQGAVTFLTLGAVAPAEVSWRCGKCNPGIGDTPAPGGSH